MSLDCLEGASEESQRTAGFAKATPGQGGQRQAIAKAEMNEKKYPVEKSKGSAEEDRWTTMIPECRFRAMGRGEINVDPIEGEFFTTEALGSLSDALVREAILSFLDVASPAQKSH
jgi:hypothetical protein